MTSIEIRHLALDYAVRVAHDSPSVESVVARAKAYEAYLAGEQSADDPQVGATDRLREAKERFARAARQEPIRVLDDQAEAPSPATEDGYEIPPTDYYTPPRSSSTHIVTVRVGYAHLADDLEEASARLLAAANAVRGGAA